MEALSETERRNLQGAGRLAGFRLPRPVDRSGLSIPSNIAEGFERGSDREFCKFLWYAKGSSGEVRTQIYIGMEVGYIERDTGTRWLREAVEISSMLAGLIKARTSLRDKHD